LPKAAATIPRVSFDHAAIKQFEDVLRKNKEIAHLVSLCQKLRLEYVPSSQGSGKMRVQKKVL